MADANDKLSAAPADSKLAEAVRTVKNAAADRSDVVVDMRDAERMRLELLAAELLPVIAEIPAENDLFDFALSSGLQPRFWIDAVSHVAMGRDKRTYRFVRDTRNGRVVMRESTDLKPVAQAVTNYIAERIVERERMMTGGKPTSFRAEDIGGLAKYGSAGYDADSDQAVASARDEPRGWQVVLWGLLIFLFGGLVGFTLMATQLWHQLSTSLPSP